MPKRAGLLRCGKSCRLRWMNYLRPSIKHGSIAPDEEDLILRLHRLLGNRWSLIAGRIPGRTDNEIKNYWNTHLSKKLISQGIDPRTHKPLNSSNRNPLPNHHKLQLPPPPTPYPNPNPSPSPSPNLNANTNPNPMSSTLEEMDGSGGGILLHNNRNDYYGGTNPDLEEGWQNSERIGGIGLHGSGDHREEEGIDCCNDDVFSSFLDSLINEDMFLQQEQQHQNIGRIDSLINDDMFLQHEQQHQNINSSEDKSNNNLVDPVIFSSAPGFGSGSILEASISYQVTAHEEINGQFIEQVVKQV